MWITVSFFCCPTVDDLASGLDVHSVPQVHATGSTVRLASRVTEMSNRYVNIVTVGNVGDGQFQTMRESHSAVRCVRHRVA